MTAAPVSPAPIWDVINGFAAYHALVASLDLGVVDAVSEGGQVTAVEISERIGAADPTHVALLADLLVSLGILRSTGDRYELTEVSDRFLRADSPAQMRALVRLSPGPYAAWAMLADTIRTGVPAVRVTDEPNVFLAPLVEATAPTQEAVAGAVWRHLADSGLVPDDALVVDLGAGSGAWGATLLRQRPGARSVAVDLPGVVETTVRMCADVAERVEVLAGDYLTVDLPDRADAVVLGHVLRSEPPARARALLHRAIAIAGPDGVVVVADYPRPEPATPEEHDRTARLAAARHDLTLSLTMLAATAGSGVTQADLRTWAEQAGASIVERLEPMPRQHVFLIRTTSAIAPDRTQPSTEDPS